jgi:hypothetical protein
MKHALDHLDPDVRAAIDRRLSDLCEHGFHFFKCCQRVTIRQEVAPFGCVRCSSPRIKWHPPIPGWSERISGKSSLTPDAPKV